jgi:hypothetical protein
MYASMVATLPSPNAARLERDLASKSDEQIQELNRLLALSAPQQKAVRS